MAYVLTDGGSNVVAYPYNIGMLRRDNPNVSFPANPTNAQLAEWNVYPVTPTPQPSYDLIDEILTEATPEFNSGTWAQAWTVTNATAEQSEAARLRYEEASSDRADELLAASMKQVLEAFELSKKLHADFVAYRAALRNPSTLPGYPAATVFPDLPTNIFAGDVDLPADFENSIN